MLLPLAIGFFIGRKTSPEARMRKEDRIEKFREEKERTRELRHREGQQIARGMAMIKEMQERQLANK